MKALVFHGIGDIRLGDAQMPSIKEPTDAILRVTTSAICGTDLHMIRGSMAGMKSGRILGHEAVGIVDEVGLDVRNLKPGDRVVATSTIACGSCSYCRAGYQSQCDRANPHGPGTAFFGGPEDAGGFDGMQAEYVRIPYANVGLVKLPDEVTDEQAILLSDIFPTGWFGADLAEIKDGDTVAVFGCGPVGQFAIASAKLMGAARVFAVDCVPDRLAAAQRQGAEIVNYEKENPVDTLKRLTGGIGVDRAIDAVGVDANRPHGGPAAGEAEKMSQEWETERAKVAPKTKPAGDNWHPGDAPSQVLQWAVQALAKAGTLAIIGVYPPTMTSFPLGLAMNKNLTVKMGNCNHRHFLPALIELVRAGTFDPTTVLTQQKELVSVEDAYKAFDKRQSGWLKVALTAGAADRKAPAEAAALGRS